MTYTKADVDFHSEMGRERHPAVNVKIHSWWHDWTDEQFAVAVNGYVEDETQFVAWIRKLQDEKVTGSTWGETEFDRLMETWWQVACEQGWEDAQMLADEAFEAQDVKVFSEGRQSGWLVVHGLHDFSEWDAVALAKWRKFEGWIKSAVADIPNSALVLAAINTYDSHLAEQRDLAAMEAKWASLAGLA